MENNIKKEVKSQIYMLEVHNLSVGYGSQLLLDNLSFSVPKASFLAILGHNGSGKSTLFNAITSHIPFSGEVFINKKPISEYKNLTAGGILIKLSQKNTLSFSISVKDLVIMGRYRKKGFFELYNSEDYRSVNETLEKLNILHLAEKEFTELSGGEQQMVWLAQMIVQDAMIYLLDEPTQNLDIYNKKKIFDIMANWVEIDHKTVICITHDLHNLYGKKGFILNLSKENPELEEINPENIQKNWELLEGGRIS